MDDAIVQLYFDGVITRIWQSNMHRPLKTCMKSCSKNKIFRIKCIKRVAKMYVKRYNVSSNTLLGDGI